MNGSVRPIRSTHPEQMVTLQRPPSRVRRVVWWLSFLICVAYGLFAVVLAVTELGALLGIVDDAKARAISPVFVVHALAGAVVLVLGVIQFNPTLHSRTPTLHRRLGLSYVVAVRVAATTALASAVLFDVPVAGRVVFVVAGVLWMVNTEAGQRSATGHDYTNHAAWMTRSFAVTLFFVTFEPWTALLGTTGLPRSSAYPLAVAAAFAANLLGAEIIIALQRR